MKNFDRDYSIFSFALMFLIVIFAFTIPAYAYALLFFYFFGSIGLLAFNYYLTEEEGPT